MNETIKFLVEEFKKEKNEISKAQTLKIIFLLTERSSYRTNLLHLHTDDAVYIMKHSS